MAQPSVDSLERLYPLRTAARLTGISPDVLRAWERRYGAVRPVRTPGGTRRYRSEDLDRLRLLKAAVDAGHRIGQIAHLEATELSGRAAAREIETPQAFGETLNALLHLDDATAHRLLSLQLATLGPAAFVREIALPLVQEIGSRWEKGLTGIATEHLATGILRSLLGAALQPTVRSLMGPRVLFATPSGERHEIGLLMAALTALGAGVNPLYLGAELPHDDLLSAARESNAAAIALGIVTLPTGPAAAGIEALRRELPESVRLWVGGAGARGVDLPADVERLDSLEALERSAALLALTAKSGSPRP